MLVHGLLARFVLKANLIPVELLAVPPSDELKGVSQLVEAAAFEQIIWRLRKLPDSPSVEGLEDETNGDKVEPVCRDLHEVVRSEEVDAALKAVPSSADPALLALWHELNHIEVANVRPDRIEETKGEQHDAKELNAGRIQDSQVQDEADNAHVGDWQLPAVDVAKAWHPEQGQAPSKPEE